MNHESLPLARIIGWLVAGVVLIFAAYTAMLLVTTWRISTLSIDKAGMARVMEHSKGTLPK